MSFQHHLCRVIILLVLTANLANGQSTWRNYSIYEKFLASYKQLSSVKKRNLTKNQDAKTADLIIESYINLQTFIIENSDLVSAKNIDIFESSLDLLRTLWELHLKLPTSLQMSEFLRDQLRMDFNKFEVNLMNILEDKKREKELEKKLEKDKDKKRIRYKRWKAMGRRMIIYT